MITDEEITEMMKRAGILDAVLPFSDVAMRILRKFVAEVEKKTTDQVYKNEFICSKCGIRKNSEHETKHEF